MANVLSSAVPRAVLCSFERKGCGLRLGQQELAMAHVCVCVLWCLVLVASVAGMGRHATPWPVDSSSMAVVLNWQSHGQLLHWHLHMHQLMHMHMLYARHTNTNTAAPCANTAANTHMLRVLAELIRTHPQCIS